MLSEYDQADNRRVWSEWLRRSDWNVVPKAGGGTHEIRDAWDVGLALATEYWPLRNEVADAAEYEDDIEPAVMMTCYGLQDGAGSFNCDDLPERIRSRILFAAQAAKSASRGQGSIAAYLAHNTIAALPEEDEWHLFVLANCLDDMWRDDPSPLAGTVFSPPDIARLVADILDAAPPSLVVQED
ncbi:MAG: hypothetical protein OXL37_11395 [Chloroflexota bacterium]|nr:hypothetical protein [Chloroflexota bacterium]MDE2960491.1 hypothetical protein [Chloroflexota bacterium]